ncbi:YggT family protein [Geothermobacter ehrlichii]|uniref:YggT family protein n=1 Tax=Geothermobacter ehrlichii TaxID=213224 RepID=A0A5D3WGZ3_9BACT|nr:YggT family protein [Geothermobacter ehrlichii]TYO96360.1 YggT family protein [Geothermobacter ehrlichii]
MAILLNALATVINYLFQIYFYIVVARAIVSWVNPDPYNPIVRFLHSATDPVLYRIRRVLPLQFGGFDFSPIVLLLALEVGRQLLVGLIYSLGAGFGGY